MTKKDLLSVTDFSLPEVLSILDRADSLRGKSVDLLRGKSLALMFEKPSLRTRSSFETAIYQLGGHAVYLGPAEINMGKRESISSIAKVADGYFQAIVARVFQHKTLEELAGHSANPVVNALSDWEHPCQIYSDLYTIRRHFGALSGLTLAFVGDGQSNIARSLALALPPMGTSVVIASPKGYGLDGESLQIATERAHRGAVVRQIESPEEAVCDADIVYTDVWASMGQEAELEKRVKAFAGYMVTPSLMEQAQPNARFMHDLPAVEGNEISLGMLEHPTSLVFPQAHNRLHFQKGLLAHLFGDAV